MLSKTIKKNITSLSLSELEILCEEYFAKHGAHTEKEFVNDLYHHKHITVKEYKNVIAHEQVELTSMMNIRRSRDSGDAERNNMSGVEKTNNAKISGSNSNDNVDYTIIESIDEGAMGEIFLARDNKLNRKVAYKRIHQHVAEASSYLGRFFLEAQVTAQLQHPNIVPVYSLSINNETTGYAMKLIDGITLKDHIRETQEQYVKDGKPDEHHTLHARLEHFLKVCDAVHYAHRKGVIHRDLKPLNIMIGPYNEVYVMDWGIAKTMAVDKEMFDDQTMRVGHKKIDESDRTQQGQVLGTPAYMSPEQAGGAYDVLDHRSDLYSLGLILHELVTFHRAINGKDMDELMSKAKRGAIDKPPAYGKEADEQEQLLAIVKKATRYLPEDRYSTVADFVDDIRRFIHGEAIRARPENTKQKIMRWVTHHRKATVNIITYSMLGLFALTVMVLFQQIKSMEAFHSEGDLTNRFVATVADKSQQIDTRFLKYEALLEGLTIGATNLLNQGSRDKTPYYTNETIADATGPSDYKFSSVYGFPISVGYHVYKLAPGVNEEKVRPTLQKLNPLRHSFKSLMLKSHASEVAHDDDAAARKVIMDEGLPLVWSYIGLEEGIMAEYPGKTGYPESFDPRQRPWYRGTRDKTGIGWLSPYIDVGGRGVMLPCTSPLFDNDKNFIGVAGLGVTLEYVRKELMPMGAIKGLEETYLLNDKAEIIVSSSDKSQSYGLGTLINSVDELEVFQNTYVVNKIKKRESGHYFYIKHGREKITVYYRMDSTGLYYVANADTEELLSKPSSSAESETW